jgi:predicted nuclease with TOPRIM domain
MADKEKIRRAIKEQVDEWASELNELRKKAGTAGSEAVKNLPEKIKILEIKIEEGTARLKELAETNEESWDALKDGFESAWESLSGGVKEAAAKFKWEKDKE